jgi:hypothetical protein
MLHQLRSTAPMDTGMRKIMKNHRSDRCKGQVETVVCLCAWQKVSRNKLRLETAKTIYESENEMCPNVSYTDSH